MQVQHSHTNQVNLKRSADQLLTDEIYAPQPSKESAKKLVANITLANTHLEQAVKSQKSTLLRSLEAYSDCV